VNEVAASGEPVVITKNGKPVAQLGPVAAAWWGRTAIYPTGAGPPPLTIGIAQQDPAPT